MTLDGTPVPHQFISLSYVVYSLLFKVRIKEGTMGMSWHILVVTGCAGIGDSSG